MEQKPIFTISSDVTNLPSKGLLYPRTSSGELLETITYEQMTAKDESILLTPGLLQQKKAFDVLISTKCKGLPIKPSELLPCDYNHILLQLRVSAYGEFYTTRVTSPFTGEEFDEDVDLTLFGDKPFSSQCDENGIFSYTTKSGKLVKFKYLTVGQLRQLEGNAEAMLKMNGGIYNLLTEKMKKQIVEYGGETEESKISVIVDLMKISEARELRKHFNEVEAGLDLNYEFTCPSTAKTFQASVSLGSDFFYPES